MNEDKSKCLYEYENEIQNLSKIILNNKYINNEWERNYTKNGK